jgi:hypothetical protein
MTTEMTPDERSRKIAAYFEPEPKQPVFHDRQISRGGWWRWQAKLEEDGTPARDRNGIEYPSAPLGHLVDNGTWEPREMDDPEITLRLLSWLLERFIVSIDETQGRIEVACDSKVGATNNISFAVIGKDLADAIASAAFTIIEKEKDNEV